MVAVLDPSRTFKIGECHAAFRALRTIHRDWRLGTRHIIGGLQSSKMQHLNGLTATVREHRRYGHPCFLPKPEGDSKLRLCVRWEKTTETLAGASGALLLEPRFLALYLKTLQDTTRCHDTILSERVPEDGAPSRTLLTSKRCACPPASFEGKARLELSSSLQAIEEMEPTSNHKSKARSSGAHSRSTRRTSAVRTKAQVEGPVPCRPIPTCTGGFLAMLSWLVGASGPQPVCTALSRFHGFALHGPSDEAHATRGGGVSDSNPLVICLGSH